MTIDDLLYTEGLTKECESCPHFCAWIEYHDYDSTQAGQRMAECHADDERDCKRLNPVRADK